MGSTFFVGRFEILFHFLIKIKKNLSNFCFFFLVITLVSMQRPWHLGMENGTKAQEIRWLEDSIKGSNETLEQHAT